MFLHVSVSHSVHRGACVVAGGCCVVAGGVVVRGHAWLWGVVRGCGGGHVWLQGGIHGCGGGHAWDMTRCGQ